jgi:hypothetical protein
MPGIGDPDRRQLAGAVKLRQHQRITAIRLHPIARFGRDQRRCHHDAVMTQAGQQPVQAIAARTGFVAEAQATPPFGQPRRQPCQNLGTVCENPDLADLAAAAAFGNCDRDRRHIQPDVGDSIHQARLPCMRLCAGRSGITLDILHVERRAADHSANIGSRASSTVPTITTLEAPFANATEALVNALKHL